MRSSAVLKCVVLVIVFALAQGVVSELSGGVVAE